MQLNFNFSEEWIILVLIGFFIGFVIYLSILSRKNQNKEKDQNMPKK